MANDDGTPDESEIEASTESTVEKKRNGKKNKIITADEKAASPVSKEGSL